MSEVLSQGQALASDIFASVWPRVVVVLGAVAVVMVVYYFVQSHL